MHRILGAHLDGKHYEADLHAIADQSSDAERRAAEAERELVEWKKVKFMIDRVGDEFDALIISTTRFGFFVELQDMFIEGLVPLDTLPGDRFGYHENVRKIMGVRQPPAILDWRSGDCAAGPRGWRREEAAILGCGAGAEREKALRACLPSRDPRESTWASISQAPCVSLGLLTPR